MKAVKAPKARNLMVYDHYSPRKYSQGCFVPYIRLRGKWLEEAGFGIGDQVKITVTENGLLISPDKNK